MGRKWTGKFEPKPGTVCHGFNRLSFIAPCPMKCAFCYLEGTYWRGKPEPASEADVPEIIRQIEGSLATEFCHYCRGRGYVPFPPGKDECFACKGTGGVVFNAGELSDSFCPPVAGRITKALIERFREQKQHKLLLVSKAIPLWLQKVAPSPQVILSFSFAQNVFCDEPIAPAWYPAENLKALISAGWEVRLRLDPMIEPSFDLPGRIAAAFKGFRFSRITLGSLRFTANFLGRMKKGSPAQQLLAEMVEKDDSTTVGNHPYRLGKKTRKELYGRALELLHGDFTNSIGLCKETTEAWRDFGFVGVFPGEFFDCNCTM
jgi:DNA repair photolyase